VHRAPGIPHALCFQGGKFTHDPGEIAPRDRGSAPEMAHPGTVVRARSPDICAILAFPIVPKTLYGAARPYHRQSRIIDQYQRLGGILGLWRAV
jgi:hypothetical protein